MLRDSLPEDLQPYESALFGMVRDALHRYSKDFGRIRVTTSTIRGERNNIHDCMTAVGKTRFPYVISGNSFLILIGRWRIRPKKFNVKLETANYPTQASFNFDHQVTNTLFPEMEPINLNVGYVPDQIDVKNSTIWLTQPGPGGWAYALKPGSAAAAIPIPPPTDPNAQTPKSRIKAKRTKLPKTQDNEG